MKKYKIKATSKAIVILNGVAYTKGKTIDLIIEEATLEAIMPFIELESKEDVEVKKTTKKPNVEKQTDESLNDFIENNF